jgi:uncharacterized Zn finger protein
MSWGVPTAPPATRRSGDDGIVASSRPGGWLAEEWHAVLRGFGAAHSERLARGRTYAKAGRVRELWFSPGLATAEFGSSPASGRAGAAKGGDPEHQVSVRVRVFSNGEWSRVVEILLRRLWFIAALLEGHLPRELVGTLQGAGISLLPSREELDGDCDCSDYLLPCAHMAAVHTLLADALDGDPFLLLTLRGRTREQLLLELRRRWGDAEPLRSEQAVSHEAPPEADWYSSEQPLRRMHFEFVPPTTTAVGLRALGPPPGDPELGRALLPLYEAGAAAAMAIAHTDLVPAPEDAAAAPRPTRNKKRDPDEPITEELVNALSAVECARSQDLAEQIGATVADVRQELIELEKLGIVYRTGQTRGTRWWLG